MKTVKLSNNSLLVRLYRYIYRSEPPQSLCPLVWKDLIGVIFFIPYFIITLPIFIISLSRNLKYAKTTNSRLNTILECWVVDQNDNMRLLLSSFGCWIILIGLGWLGKMYIFGFLGLFFGWDVASEDTGAFYFLNILFLILILGWIYFKKVKVVFEEYKRKKTLKKARVYFKRTEKLSKDQESALIWRYKSREVNNTWDVIKESIKAWYNKNCPIIEYSDNEE